MVHPYRRAREVIAPFVQAVTLRLSECCSNEITSRAQAAAGSTYMKAVNATNVDQVDHRVDRRRLVFAKKVILNIFSK